MSWEPLCSVNEALGFKKLKEFNIAMLAKQAWRLINGSNHLVTNLMKARYYPDSDFLNVNLDNNSNYIWWSILEAQDVMKQGCRKRIDNGDDTMAWKVPWLPCVENGCLTSTMPHELENINVQSLMDESKSMWDEEILSDICNERDSTFIHQIPISLRNKEDSWYWMLEYRGDFSVKSCNRRLRGEVECIDKEFWRKVWKMKLSGKVIKLGWCAARDMLPTTIALRCKQVDIDDICVWCKHGPETAVHVLFECIFVTEVWGMLGMLSIVYVEERDSVKSILKRAFSLANTEQCMIIVLLCWGLWSRRNKWVWEKVVMSALELSRRR